jgi:hypothetical protein
VAVDEKPDRGLRDLFLQVIEDSLEAQLRAVRRLRAGKEETPRKRRREGRSQVDLAEDILRKAGTELHVGEIIERIAQVHHVRVDRESLVSALTKKVERGDRFVRSGPNTFTLRTQR